MDLKLCPMCLSPYSPTPDDEFGAQCPFCGQDLSRQDAVDMDEESYHEAPRADCLYCGNPILEGARMCPNCQALVPEPVLVRR